MMQDQPVPFGEVEFVRVDHVMIDVGGATFVWADGGNPAVLDRAATSILECFSEPATADQVADDLVEVVGLSRDDARRASATAAHWFRNAGLIVATDREPMESWRFDYPPAAST